MAQLVEDTIAVELRRLFGTISIKSPWEYMKYIGFGVNDYFGMVLQERSNLKIMELLSEHSKFIAENTTPSNWQESAGRTLGAYYAHAVIKKTLLKRFGRDYAKKQIYLDDDAVKEMESGYHSLGCTLVEVAMEHSPLIKGETPPIITVRPKNPSSAVLN